MPKTNAGTKTRTRARGHLGAAAVTLAACAAVAVITPAWPASPEAMQGLAIANKYCARCHAVGLSGASPHKEAPPFREFAAKWPLENLEEALAEGIVTGHKDMPAFVFEPPEIAALIAHLEDVGKAVRKTPK